jgi:transcriptional regulator with XRE-family HTH domain
VDNSRDTIWIMLKDAILSKMANEGMNQQQFAKHIGISFQVLNHILCGRRDASKHAIKAILAKYPDMLPVILS